ncbi:MAG: uroporphyrinogen-III synthase [Pseudomonadota bacterium]
MTRPGVLILRSELEARRLAEVLAAKGYAPIVSPVLSIAPVAFDWPDPPLSGSVLTSANAVSPLLAHTSAARLIDGPVWCVGTRAADQLGRLWHGAPLDIRPDGKDVHALAGRLAAERLNAPLVHFHGQQTSTPLSHLLPSGPEIIDRVVYEALPVGELNGAARDALAHGKIASILHFSPRSARLAVAAIIAANRRQPFQAARHVCLSQHVADALTEALGVRPAGGVSIAGYPDEAGLLAALDG